MAGVKVYVLILSPPTDVDVRRKAIVYQLIVVIVQVYLYSWCNVLLIKKNPYISNLVRTWVVGSAFCLLDTCFWSNFGVLKPDRWCNSERARLEFMFLWCCVVLCLYVPFKYLSFLAPNFFFWLFDFPICWLWTYMVEVKGYSREAPDALD